MVPPACARALPDAPAMAMAAAALKDFNVLRRSIALFSKIKKGLNQPRIYAQSSCHCQLA